MKLGEKEITMLPVQDIKKGVSGLTGGDELAEFRAWFEEFDAALWDKQFEEDVKAGRLNAVSERAIADFKSGRAKEL
jgi:hypothetical protein